MEANQADTEARDAVEMKRNYEFNIDNENVPKAVRDNIPEEYTERVRTQRGVQRITKLLQGEQGFRVQTNRAKGYSICQFERGDAGAVAFIIPTDALVIGAKENVTAVDHGIRVTTTPSVAGPNSIVRFIRMFWALAREQRQALAALGIPAGRAQRLFDDDVFDRNVNALIEAITPEAKAVFGNPNFDTLARDMIRGLVRVNSMTTSPKMCYVRLYTKVNDQKEIVDTAVYVGTTETPGVRFSSHVTDTNCSSLHHYKIARGYPADRRYMFVFMNLDGFDGDMTAMAEETAVALFDSYIDWHFASRESQNQTWTRESTRATAMYEMARLAHRTSGFPQLRWKGCNVFTPFFHGATGGRAWIRQYIPATPYQPRMYRYTSGFIFPTIWEKRSKDGKQFRKSAQLFFAPKLSFKFNQQTIDGGNFKEGMLCNLVVEVTVDKVRHPRPYITVPDVGVYEHFQEGSCLALYVESYNEQENTWYSTQIFNQLPLNAVTKGVYKPQAWLFVKRVLQLLEGTRYNGTNDHFTMEAYTVESMQYVLYDHLGQTIEFLDVPHPVGLRTPLPRLMSYEDNAALMFHKYPDLAIGPSQLPSASDRNIQYPDKTDKSKKISVCDFCWSLLQMSTSKRKCDGEVRQCTNCKLLVNRPCTWTDRPTLLEWQRQGDPLHLWFGSRESDIIHKEIVEPFGARVMIESMAARANFDDRDREVIEEED